MLIYDVCRTESEYPKRLNADENVFDGIPIQKVACDGAHKKSGQKYLAQTDKLQIKAS